MMRIDNRLPYRSILLLLLIAAVVVVIILSSLDSTTIFTKNATLQQYRRSLLRDNDDNDNHPIVFLTKQRDPLFWRPLFWFRQFKYKRRLPELFEPKNRPPSYTKAIVIGSGFGGSIAALRLAEAGIPTTVLERGQEWPTPSPDRDIFAYEPLRDGRGFWHRKRARNPCFAKNAPNLRVDSFGGVLDITEYENIEVWRGSCVGGGSKVFTGVMIQPQQEYFDAVFNGTTVSYTEMNEIYYPRVRDKLKVSPVPDDIYETRPFGKSRIWDQQARNAGYTIERPDSLFNWTMVRNEMKGICSKSASIGMSNMGNSNGAKYDTTQNYLKEARETGFVEVYSNQQVTEIRETDSGYQVDIQNLDPFGNIIDNYSIQSDYLFLAAGSIGTSELLVKAKAKGTITGLNDEIGRTWGGNGDVAAVRSFNTPSKFFQFQASPCTSKIHDTDGVKPVTFEAWYVPVATPDVGFQASLGMVLDLDNYGRFEYNEKNDKVDLIWSETAVAETEDAARHVNDKLAQAKPRSIPGFFPFAPDVWAGFTAHPLGGAVINKATDAYGRVKSRLYVVDGALIPGSTGAVNPSLTIAALAERNMERIIAEDF